MARSGQRKRTRRHRTSLYALRESPLAPETRPALRRQGAGYRENLEGRSSWTLRTRRRVQDAGCSSSRRTRVPTHVTRAGAQMDEGASTARGTLSSRRLDDARLDEALPRLASPRSSAGSSSLSACPISGPTFQDNRSRPSGRVSFCATFTTTAWLLLLRRRRPSRSLATARPRRRVTMRGQRGIPRARSFLGFLLALLVLVAVLGAPCRRSLGDAVLLPDEDICE